jgi:hypothetical protein
MGCEHANVSGDPNAQYRHIDNDFSSGSGFTELQSV